MPRSVRKSGMTHEERMNALLNYQKPDRVPIFSMGGGFAMINCGYTLTDLETDPQKYWNALRWTCEQYGWEPLWQQSPNTVLGGWDFGGKVKMPDSSYVMAISVESPPVKKEADVWNLRMPDPKTAGAIPKRMEFSRLQDDAGWPVTFTSRSPFTMGADICGVEQFGRWLGKKPELCERLIRIALKHIFNTLQYWVDTFGAEKIVFYMHSPTEANQIISPKHFQKYALPYHKESQQRMRALGVDKFMFHICGEQNMNLPYLAELASSEESWPHPSILSFGDEIKLDDAAKDVPYDMRMGNGNPTSIQMGAPEEVYELSRICIEKGKEFAGGFILGPGCQLPPRAPAYNIWTMTKAVNDFGWYD